ncbi:MAG: PEP-CTERM sorting domain-containing protein [Verrucomicrobiota bacterium]
MLSALGLALLLPAVAHSAAINYGTAGVSYGQNFDTLASSGTSNPWSNGETITGWHWLDEQGAVPATYTTNSGSGARDVITSLGNSADRAFGGQNDDLEATYHFGAQILNATGNTLDSFTLAYTGEQWRMIRNEGTDQLTFEYQIFNAGEGSLAAATGWNAVAELNFIAPRTTTGGSTGLDGNLPANRVESITSTVAGLTWSAGQEVWLRWADYNPGSSDFLRAQLGIDDVSFSATAAAIPEPSTSAVLVGLGALGLVSLRRRCAGC